MSGKHSYGAVFECNDNGDGATFVTMAGFVSSKGAVTVGTVKLTDHSSPSGAKEKGPGMIDAGKRTISVRATKAEYARFFAFLRVTKLWRISWPLFTGETTPTRWKCSGHITSIGDDLPDPESDETVMMDMEIDFTGLPVFTQGS